MDKERIVTNQPISDAKRRRARELRQKMTPAERRLWGKLRANRFDGWHFRRQQIIDGFIVDFYCHKAGLIVEVDGPIHDAQQVLDAKREQALRERGLTIIRFTNRQVMNNMGMVLKQIKQSLIASQSTHSASHREDESILSDNKSPFPPGKGLGDGS